MAYIENIYTFSNSADLDVIRKFAVDVLGMDQPLAENINIDCRVALTKPVGINFERVQIDMVSPENFGDFTL